MNVNETSEMKVDSFKVRRTCCEMIEDRGYKLLKDPRNETLADFQKECKSCLDWTLEGCRVIDNGEDPQLRKRMLYEDYIKIINQTKMDSGIIKMKFAEIRKEQQNHCIPDDGTFISTKRCFLVVVVHQGRDQSTVVTRYEDSDVTAQLYLQAFFKQQLVINITKHILVPKHILLNERQKRAVLEKYSAKENQLPIIEAKDPVARYLGMLERDVVQIHRPSETSGIYITYRICKPEFGK